MNEAIRKPPMPFVPSVRGSLTDLEKKPSQFAAIAPESPRPPEMLSRVTVCRGADLTPLDQATHEIMLSQAFEIDPTMQQDDYSISLKALVRYLGRDLRKEDVIRSVAKLRDITVNFGHSSDPLRRYEDVRLIDMWREFNDDDLTIGYSFLKPIRELMRSMPRYAHLELAVLGDGLMSTKWGPALYKHLLLASKAKEWRPGGDNDIIIQMSPEEVADVVDFPRVNNMIPITKLTDMVEKTIADLKKVRRFIVRLDPEVDIIRETGRGRRIRYYIFRIRLNPPRPLFVRGGMIARPGVGAKDVPEYQVSSGIWEKAELVFDKRSSFSGFNHKAIFDLWLMALHEAIDARALSDGYETKMYRGPGLLSAISEQGSDFAAWAFLGEEDAQPDLITLKTRELSRASQVARADRAEQRARRLRKFHANDIATAERKAEVEKDKVILDVDSPFATCTKATMTLRDMSDDEFAAEIETPIFETKWSGDRQFFLAIRDRNTQFRIKPSAEEWDKLTRNYRVFMVQEIEYK